MNGLLLMIPLFLIRFVLLGALNREALVRAAFFAPMAGGERAVLILYQASNLFLILYPLALQIHTDAPLFLIALPVFVCGICILALSTVSFAGPQEGGINIRGAYRFSRNPMYVGYLVYFLGCAMLTRSPALLAALAVFAVSTHWVILAEERWCLQRFGDAYARYMRSVRRYF